MLTEEQKQTHYQSQSVNDLETSFARKRYGAALQMFGNDFFTDKLIVDIGCGYGVGPLFMANYNPRKIIGIEYNSKSVELANKNYSHSLIEYRQGMGHQTNLESDYCDLVTSVEMIEHNDEEARDLFLKEAHRILKANGCLFISTPEQRLNKNQYPSGSHYTEYSFEELVDIVELFGFKFQKVVRKNLIDNVSMALSFTTNK